MAKRLKSNKDGVGFYEYRMGNFARGIIFTTILNFIIGFMMKDAFGPIGIIGMFFLSENVFFCTLMSNHNYKNIIYLNREVIKLKREVQRLKKSKNTDESLKKS